MFSVYSTVAVLNSQRAGYADDRHFRVAVEGLTDRFKTRSPCIEHGGLIRLITA